MARRVRIGLGHHKSDIGHARSAREPLFAVQFVRVVSLANRRRLHAGRIGARSLLSHRIANALLAVQQGLEKLLLLIVRAMRQQRHHGRVVGTLRVHRQRAEIALAEFHLNECVGEGTKAHAAIFLRDERAPQALCPRLLAQLGECRLVVGAGEQLLFRRHAFIVYPLAYLFANGLGVVRELRNQATWGFPFLKFLGWATVAGRAGQALSVPSGQEPALVPPARGSFEVRGII